MYDYYSLYTPITSAPFRSSDSYMEILPCKALRPYIRCFWGTKKPVEKTATGIPSTGLVTPDTCMDIIFDVNFTENKIDARFMGGNDQPFQIHYSNDKNQRVSTFGIRFYLWSAILFSEESMAGVKNKCYDAGQYFSKFIAAMTPFLFERTSLIDLSETAQHLLLNQIEGKKGNAVLEEAIFAILNRKGCLKISDLSSRLHVSHRQLQRVFFDQTGFSPKQIVSLIRYQYLWRDILTDRPHMLDAVESYGFTDQAHLLRDFKRFHTMTPGDARLYALNKKDAL